MKSNQIPINLFQVIEFVTFLSKFFLFLTYQEFTISNSLAF